MLRSIFYKALLIVNLLVFFLEGRPLAATLFQDVGIASSPNPIGSGARAVGMGGAFIAIADDATAASWNPAGLIQLERPELSIVGTSFYRRESFSSAARPEIDNTGKVDENNLNYFSASYPFRIFQRNIVVSINYQRLFEFNRQFDTRLVFAAAALNVTQNKHFNQNGFIGALGLASAIQVTPKLSLGATLNIWTDELFWKNGWTETFSEQAVGTLGGSPVIIDTQIRDEYSRFRGVNANLGLLWEINNRLKIGAVIKTPFQASIRHQFHFSQTNSPGPASSTELTEKVKLRMPLSYGLGFAWRVSDALSFAFDAYRSEWKKYIMTDAQGNEFSPISGKPESESDVKNTTQLRIGGEYLFIGSTLVVPLRGGLFYDPEPSLNAVKDFYGVSLGSGFAYKHLIFDLAYVLRWGSNIDTGNLIATSKGDITQHQVLTSLIIHF